MLYNEKKFEKYIDVIPLTDKVRRKLWAIFYYILFRPFIGKPFNYWRILLLKIFGAEIGKGSNIYASAKIPAPWNLKMGQYSCIGPQVEFHINQVFIGNKVTISQRTYICTGSHDISSLNIPYISKPIFIEDYVWIAAESFIMMGVKIGEGAIVGARSAVFKDVEPWTVVGGNPAKFIKKRELLC